MVDNELRQWLIDNAKVVQLPFNGKYLDYSSTALDGRIIKLPLVEGSTYKTWKLNEHHFQPFYHFDYILPTLDAVLDFGFDMDDFDIIERKSSDGKYDTSYLKPKKNYYYNIFGYTAKSNYLFVNYDIISSCTIEDKYLTEYHRTYCFPHMCSKIVNNTLEGPARTLFISGDSQLIPDIPVLSCYFKTIYYFDNRTNTSFINRLMNETVIDVLFAIGAAGPKKYLEHNLK